MSSTVVILAAALFLASVIQTAMGFGVKFALLPLMLVLYPKDDTVVVLLALGLLVNFLILALGGSRPRVDPRGLAVLLLWTLPGVLIGIRLLGLLSGRALQASAGVMVLCMVCGRLRPWLGRGHPHPWLRRRSYRRMRPTQMPAIAGLAGGVFTATTSLNGPLVSAHLLSRHVQGRALRDQTVAYALGANILAVALLLLRGSVDLSAVSGALTWMLPVALVGFAVGRVAFKVIRGRRYEPVVMTAVGAAGALALALAII